MILAELWEAMDDPIVKRAIGDNRLDFHDIGVLVILAALPDGKTMTPLELAQMGLSPQFKIDISLVKLVKYGYLNNTRQIKVKS